MKLLCINSRSARKLKSLQALFCSLVLLILAQPVCADAPQEAREKLNGLQVPYTGDALVSRAAAGDLQTVQLFLKAGMDPNVKNARGATPLMAAATQGHGPIAKLLLENGADVEAQSQEKSVMKRWRTNLRKKTVQYGGTPLMQAARNGHVDVIFLLLDKGANLETKDAKYGRTALLWAIVHSRNAVVQALLDKGASPVAQDKQGRTTMVTAVLYAKPETLTLLLDRLGAQEQVVVEKPFLRFAAAGGRTDNMKILLAKGEDPNTPDKDGRTALMWAAGAGKKDAVKLLLDLGANADARDKDGKKALDMAKSDPVLMELLFKAEDKKSTPSEK